VTSLRLHYIHVSNLPIFPTPSPHVLLLLLLLLINLQFRGKKENTMSPASSLRIAILECDIPIGNTREKYGGYGNLFKELLLKGKDEVRDGKDGKEGVDLPELDVTKWNVVDEELYPKLEEVDVVLVSGSRELFYFLTCFLVGMDLLVLGVLCDSTRTFQSSAVDIVFVRALAKILPRHPSGFNSFDDDIWILKLVDFIKKILFEQKRVRLVGVCFGHQIIGRALGQKVGRSEGGWEISVTPMQLTAKGKEVFGVEELVSSNVLSKSIMPSVGGYIISSQQAHKRFFPNRPSTKCTKTQSSPTRPRSNTWATPRAATFRACTRGND
jgi:hypothetical protein